MDKSEARRQPKDAVLQALLDYFHLRGYFLAVQTDLDDGRDYPYIGKRDDEASNFIVIKQHIGTIGELRAANDDCYTLFMSHMTDLLSERTDPDLADAAPVSAGAVPALVVTDTDRRPARASGEGSARRERKEKP
jgi:hypothetical protein